ncbi:WD40 repeat domain-containing protein [Marinomonas sp. NPDC078689]|uniref:WD40 repeat domain-containing protein n=1 Tax=Marinomonas sp. NPDC078689 TaxID=3364147 RepID=UPI0037C51B86
MKLIANKALKLGAVIGTAAMLLSCSAKSPERTAEYAVQGLYSAALSNDGSAALVGSIQHGGSYWTTALNDRRFNWNHAKGEYTSLISVDIDPTNAFAATGSARTLVLWNTSSGQSAGFWNTPGDIKSLKLTNNGDYALLGLDDQTARYFDVKNGGIKQTFRTGAIVRSVDVSPDGRLGLTGDDNRQVILWDTQTGEKKFSWLLSNRISTVALSADGKYAFGAAQLGNAKVWSTLTGREVALIDTGSLDKRQNTISQAVFSADDRKLLLGGINRRVSLRDISSGEVLQEWDLYLKEALRPTGSSVLALSYGKDGRYYAIGSNGYLNVLE